MTSLVIVAVAFFGGLFLYATGIPAGLPVVYLISSVAAFAVYACDKAAARAGRWRTPEVTLHIISLFGGWPGAIVAQRVLHHKSRKASFQVVFWLTVLVNCAVAAVLIRSAR